MMDALKIQVQSLMYAPFVVCCMPHVEALKLIIFSSGQSVLWDQRAITYPVFLSKKIVVMHWSDPMSYNEPFMLLHSLDVWF